MSVFSVTWDDAHEARRNRIDDRDLGRFLGSRCSRCEERKQRLATLPQEGPLQSKLRDPYELIVIEEGSGVKNPQLGDTVRAAYVLTLEADASIVDMVHDFEYN